MVTNILPPDFPENASDEEKVKSAITNMITFFDVVGVTEQLSTTADMVGHTFPWLSETVPGSDIACPLPHDNASPKSNHCGKDHQSHVDFGKHPDAATRSAIEAHNQLDLQLYEAAVQYFELEKQVLGIR